MNKRHPYAAPKLVRLVSVADLTQAGHSKAGTDLFCYSGPARARDDCELT